MKLTNNNQLPLAICDAVSNDAYTKGDSNISVTGLLRPPRIRILEEEHENEITEDASDRIWSLLGQSIHTILERANRDAIAERRLSIECEGWKVSGGMDVYQEEGILLDYKVTSVWKLIHGDLDEWEKQLNLYAVILRAHGHQVKQLQVVSILRDWSKGEAQRNSDYPQAQIVNVNINLWTEERALKFMKERVILHQQASIENLPLCTKEDRWARDDVFAVMKIGRKTAIKLYNNNNDAENHIKKGETGLYIQHRPGVNIRCESYCRVSKFCTLYQNELKKAS